MSKSRLIGGYPVIGIRPTIDGRRGPLKVRERFEDQTMNLAGATAYEEKDRCVLLRQRCTLEEVKIL